MKFIRYVFFFRFSTQEMAEPLCDYIRNFGGPRAALHRAVERQIIRIVETHRLFLNLGGGVYCHSMLAHMMLFAAARVAFLSRFPNSTLVVRLLAEIYRCDKSFKYLLMGKLEHLCIYIFY